MPGSLNSSSVYGMKFAYQYNQIRNFRPENRLASKRILPFGGLLAET
jgi:hypothetical protein